MKNFSFIKMFFVVAFAFAGIRATAKPVTFKLSEINTFTTSSIYDTYTEVKLKNGEIIRFYDNNRVFESKSDCYIKLCNVFSDAHVRNQISTKDYEKQMKNIDETVTVNTTTNNRNYLK